MPLFDLRPGITGQAGVQALKDVANAAWNASNPTGGRPSGEQLLTTYFTWAEAAHAQLGNALGAEQADDLVHTQTYWALRTSTGDTVRLITLTANELQGRHRPFTGMAERLDKEWRRWADYNTTIVVPDTNMFLQEGKPFRSIDWPEAIDGRSQNEIRLVLPMVVIHELDRLKRQGNKTTASLARQALRWLRENLPSQLDGRSAPLVQGSRRTTIEVDIEDGPNKPDDADGAIIRFTRRLDNIAVGPALLVTYDLGMRLRAAAFGVRAIQLADD
jgi:hypothetical protein